MNKKLTIGLVILIAVILVGWFAYSQQGVKMDDGGAVIDKEGEQMLEKDGDAMESDNMEGDAMMEDGHNTTDGDAMMDKPEEGAMMDKGSYGAYAPEKLAMAADGDIVLFFRADWCPTCRTLDADIRSNLSAIPDGVTILGVNYDTETELKQKYGVTYQHTLVQVDAQGNQVAKWTGSPTLASLLTRVN